MHSLVILTAMTATSGLFGGHRQVQSSCAGGSCGRPAAVAYAPATCATGNCGGSYGYAAPRPAYPYAPAQAAAPAPAAYAPAPAYGYAPAAPAAPAMNYQSYYYPSACASGNCARR